MKACAIASPIPCVEPETKVREFFKVCIAYYKVTARPNSNLQLAMLQGPL
jgi:hypothetical protein